MRSPGDASPISALRAPGRQSEADLEARKEAPHAKCWRCQFPCQHCVRPGGRARQTWRGARRRWRRRCSTTFRSAWARRASSPPPRPTWRPPWRWAWTGRCARRALALAAPYLGSGVWGAVPTTAADLEAARDLDGHGFVAALRHGLPWLGLHSSHGQRCHHSVSAPHQRVLAASSELQGAGSAPCGSTANIGTWAPPSVTAMRSEH